MRSLMLRARRHETYRQYMNRSDKPEWLAYKPRSGILSVSEAVFFFFHFHFSKSSVWRLMDLWIKGMKFLHRKSRSFCGQGKPRSDSIMGQPGQLPNIPPRRVNTLIIHFSMEMKTNDWRTKTTADTGGPYQTEGRQRYWKRPSHDITHFQQVNADKTPWAHKGIKPLC